MAHYDKYEPYAGGFRAPLNADWLEADLNKTIGVGLNAAGEIVKGKGNTGIIGVLVLSKKYKAGHAIDVMTQGEIVEFGGVAGTVYASNDAGVITATVGAVVPAGSTRVGQTVESGRLVVRVIAGAVAA